MSPASKNGYTPRLKEIYYKTIISEMMKKCSLENQFQVPRVKKVVLNMGVSEARENAKILDLAAEELMVISGQKPEVRKAKKAISNFKLRQGMPIGVRVTLRGARMYEFLDRLISVAIPRIRDFQGLNPHKGFDGQGNYNLGLTEQYVFPEIDMDKSDKARGLNVTIVTNAKKNDLSLELLSQLGLPFKKPKKN